MGLSPGSHGSLSAEWLSSRIIDPTSDAVIPFRPKPRRSGPEMILD